MNLQELVAEKRHHDRGRFRNPFSHKPQGRLRDVFRWKFLSRNQFRGLYGREEVRPVSFNWQQVRDCRGLSVTFVNHASVLIKEGPNCFLVDPIFYGLSFSIRNFSPLLLKLDEMPTPGHVLLTHGHFDHLDLPTLRTLPAATRLITPLGYQRIIRQLAPRPATRLDWLEEYEAGDARVTLLPCNHWTMRNPLVGPNRSLWGSYLVRTAGGRNIYISGDTAYFDGFREIGRMYEIDLAILNVGAYEPRWFMQSSHMNPVEAVRAFRELGAKRLLVVHWGTFRLGDEPVYLPPLAVRDELEKVGMRERLVDLSPGQTFFGD